MVAASGGERGVTDEEVLTLLSFFFFLFLFSSLFLSERGEIVVSFVNNALKFTLLSSDLTNSLSSPEERGEDADKDWTVEDVVGEGIRISTPVTG